MTPEKLWERFEHEAAIHVGVSQAGTPMRESWKHALGVVVTERSLAAVEKEREECALIAKTCYRQAKIDEANGYAIERGDTSACWIEQRIRSRGTPTASSEGEGEDGE